MRARRSRYSRLLLCVPIWTGCATVSTPEELAEFEQAGPMQPMVDEDELVRAKLFAGPYRPVVDDVLELTMPAVLRESIADRRQFERIEPHLCRVKAGGRITLPVVGELEVSGKALPEIESVVAAAYHPKYLIHPPSVVASVREYRIARVAVVGAVQSPGIYDLQSNEMSLVALLTKAGGINTEEGAGVIRIEREGEGDDDGEAGEADEDEGDGASEGESSSGSQVVVLPVRGLNVPFADVSLRQGDRVEVERLNPEVFTVIGLVNKAGAYPYPPGVKYNLLQGLAFAAGLNDLADPQYAKIYRQASDGKVLEAVFDLRAKGVKSPLGIMLKPGDVVAVEHTAWTRFHLILAEILQIRAGVNLDARYTVWNPYDYNQGSGNNAGNALQNTANDLVRTLLAPVD